MIRFIFIEKNFFSVLVLFLDDYAWLTNPVSHFIYLIDSVHCAVDTFFPVLVHAKLEQANVNKFEMHCWISQFVDNILQSNDCLFFNASLLLWKKTSSRYKIVFMYIRLIQKTFQMIITFKQNIFLSSQSVLYQYVAIAQSTIKTNLN